MTEEYLEKKAEEYVPNIRWHDFSSEDLREEMKLCYREGMKDGYQEGLKAKINAITISDCPVKDKWHYPSKGELPKEDKEYLVYMNDGTIDIQEITMDGDGHYYFNGISWAFNDLIAWRELPKPPKEEE